MTVLSFKSTNSTKKKRCSLLRNRLLNDQNNKVFWDKRIEHKIKRDGLFRQTLIGLFRDIELFEQPTFFNTLFLVILLKKVYKMKYIRKYIKRYNRKLCAI